MSDRLLIRMLASLAAGSIGVAIGLYFGRFVAGLAALPFAASRQAVPFATGAAWWALIGLAGSLGLAFTAVRRRRIRFVSVALVGFVLGGVLAAWLGQIGSSSRNAALTGLAAPLGGALAGLIVGLSARLQARSALLAIAGALALAIARPHLDALIPPPDWIALLAPGALIGAALAVLAPDQRDTRRSADPADVTRLQAHSARQPPSGG